MSSHVTIKKNLIIFHRPGDWIKIYTKILQDFGQGMAVRTRLRRELGFSYRHHRGLVPTDHQRRPVRSSLIQYQDGPKMMHYEDQIHVDFYNEAAQSWFQLRYL